MPNLNSWIEAQLKRGHSREAIKKQLLKRGYSRKAVAEVDRLSGKEKPNFANLQIFIIVIAIVFISVFIAIDPQQKFVRDSDVEEQALGESVELYRVYEGRYAGTAENAIFLLGEDGKETIVRHDVPGTKILMYKQLGDNIVARIDGIEPELGEPVTIYAKLENGKQTVMRMVINSQDGS